MLYPSGHLRHDFLIKYTYFVKCYLERFASITDPEKCITNVAQQKEKKSRETWFQITRDIASSMTSQNWRFPTDGEWLQTLISEIFTTNVT